MRTKTYCCYGAYAEVGCLDDCPSKKAATMFAQQESSMPDDIVERLRFLASGQDDVHSVAIAGAADEITRLRAALSERAAVPQGWRPIETAPTSESESFSVLRPANSVACQLVQQVSWFEGCLYPDELDGAIDYGDRITDATHWRPIPAMTPIFLDSEQEPKP